MLQKAPSKIKSKKAVMVYIHGGGFYFGSGTASIYGPDYLIGHDVIYVTLNYRLHIFGTYEKRAALASCHSIVPRFLHEYIHNYVRQAF